MNQDEKGFDLDSEWDENSHKNLDRESQENELIQENEIEDNQQEKAADQEENADIDEKAVGQEDSPEDIEEDFTISTTHDDGEAEQALMDINASLARQICEEMDTIATAKEETKKMNKTRKIQFGILAGLLVLLLFIGFLGFTKAGNKVLMRMGVDIGGKVWSVWTKDFEKNPEKEEDYDFLDQDDLDSDAQEVDPIDIVWPEHPGAGRREEGVYNILLIGEESLGSGGSRGRTDVIIIATLNTISKEVKLTSLLRDTLVQIPGYKENKLNSAYSKGGLDLLYETISLNYNICLDGCVKVNFDSFEKIIDKLGGVEVELTASEARYLNNTNYISNPKYRNVKAGVNLLNGNQALGYSRVRKRANINGTNNDYGRTERHRIILDAIFDKYKTLSKVDLAGVMLGVLPMITSDIDSKNFEMLLNSFIDMGMGDVKLQQLRIPVDGSFTDNVKVRGLDVLIPNWNKNLNELHTFIFGDSNY